MFVFLAYAVPAPQSNPSGVFLVIIAILIFFMGYAVGIFSRKKRISEIEELVTEPAALEEKSDKRYWIRVIGPDGKLLMDEKITYFDNSFHEKGYTEYKQEDGKFGCIQPGNNLLIHRGTLKTRPQ